MIRLIYAHNFVHRCIENTFFTLKFATFYFANFFIYEEVVHYY